MSIVCQDHPTDAICKQEKYDMKIFLKASIFMFIIPSLTFAANGYWDTMIQEQDNWYIPIGKLTGKIITSVTGQTTNIVGATITIAETGQSVKTGIDGAYTLNDIPIGKYTVKIQMNGFNPIQLTDVSISEGGTTNFTNEMAVGCGLKGDMDDNEKSDQRRR